MEWKNDEEYDYGKRILFSPRAKPDATKCSKLCTDINLHDKNIALVGPFDFAPPMGVT